MTWRRGGRGADQDPKVLSCDVRAGRETQSHRSREETCALQPRNRNEGRQRGRRQEGTLQVGRTDVPSRVVGSSGIVKYRRAQSKRAGSGRVQFRRNGVWFLENIRSKFLDLLSNGGENVCVRSFHLRLDNKVFRELLK